MSWCYRCRPLKVAAAVAVVRPFCVQRYSAWQNLSTLCAAPLPHLQVCLIAIINGIFLMVRGLRVWVKYEVWVTVWLWGGASGAAVGCHQRHLPHGAWVRVWVKYEVWVTVWVRGGASGAAVGCHQRHLPRGAWMNGCGFRRGVAPEAMVSCHTSLARVLVITLSWLALSSRVARRGVTDVSCTRTRDARSTPSHDAIPPTILGGRHASQGAAFLPGCSYPHNSLLNPNPPGLPPDRWCTCRSWTLRGSSPQAPPTRRRSTSSPPTWWWSACCSRSRLGGCSVCHVSGTRAYSLRLERPPNRGRGATAIGSTCSTCQHCAHLHPRLS